MNIYYNPKTKNIFIVPNHYNHSLSYITKTLIWAMEQGLTLPDNEDDIKVEVLAGDKHRRMLSIEFKSNTKPIESDEFTYWDLEAYPHLYEYLKY